jgi:nucleoside-diphosphate-sugar epimerase
MTVSHGQLPAALGDESVLDELLSEPTDALVEILSRRDGDILILGAGGKIGPTLARMARRASDAVGVSRSVIAVSRFSDGKVREQLEESKVRTHRADLFNPDDVANLPDAESIVYLVGRKFGTQGNQPLSWATNVALPSIVCQRFAGRRIVALSTLCVYPFVTAQGSGSRECDTPRPIGEYAMSALGRERVFEHYSAVNGSPTALIRLTYSVEMRYGVLVDIALRVFNGRPLDLSTGHVNVLWQADVNARILSALDFATSPASTFNVAGPEVLSVEDLGRKFAERFEKTPKFVGEAAGDAWLVAPSANRLLSVVPRVSVDRLIDWTADWIRRGGPTHEKPTHFEIRDGQF